MKHATIIIKRSRIKRLALQRILDAWMEDGEYDLTIKMRTLTPPSPSKGEGAE